MGKGIQNNSEGNIETRRVEKSNWIGWIRIIMTKPISAAWALFVGLVISLGPIAYQDFLSSPKLKGKIAGFSAGFATDVFDSTEHRIYTVFMTISNQRSKPTTIVDFRLKLVEYDGSEWVYNPYYIHADDFTMETNYQQMVMKNNKYLLNEIGNLITIDKPLSGFIYFDAKKSRLISFEYAIIELTDGIGEKHEIKTYAEDITNPELLRFLLKDIEVRDLNK